MKLSFAQQTAITREYIKRGKVPETELRPAEFDHCLHMLHPDDFCTEFDFIESVIEERGLI